MSEFKQTTPAETERLIMLVEECGEVIQAASKVLRHGYECYHPDNAPDNKGRGAPQDNRDDLEAEICDVLAAVQMLKLAGDIDEILLTSVNTSITRKLRFAYHQENED